MKKQSKKEEIEFKQYDDYFKDEKEDLIFIFKIGVEGLTRQQAEQRIYNYVKECKGEINNYSDYNIHKYWIPAKNNSCEMNVINPKWDKIKGGVQDLILIFRLPFHGLTTEQTNIHLDQIKKEYSTEKYSKFNVHSYFFVDNSINEPIVSVINPSY